LAVLRTNKRTFDKIVTSYASNGEFTGTIDSDTDKDAKYAFLYPADAYEPNTNDTLVQVLPLNGQDGTLAGVANYDYAWGEGPIVSSASSFSVEADMSSLVSICKFQFLAENGAPLERISQVILTAPQGSLYQCATLDMKKGTLDDFVKGSIKVENKNGLNGEVYVALFPSETSLHFTISTIDGKAYEASISEDAFIPQGGFVVFEPVVCTSLPLAKVGDHYYTDATWSTELNPNKKCVGVVYALENEAGKMVNTLASSSHGRVVALKDVVQKATWALSSEDVAELANQETLCDTLTIGCLPYFDGTVNSYFDDDKAHQLGGVRVDEANGLIANWYSNGALNDFEGEQNTSYIDHNISQYPAGTYPTRFSEGITGWYLPSLGDLALLWSLHKTGIVRADKQECFKDFAEFLNRYQSEIIHSFTTVEISRKTNFEQKILCSRLSNGPMEGFHRKPKDLKRNSRGLSNFDYTRNRILWSTRKNQPIRIVPNSIEQIQSYHGKHRGSYKNKKIKINIIAAT
jgi:hypothetical protein